MKRMKYNAVLERLQNLINYVPTQKELCEIIGIKQSAMTNRATRNSDFTSEEIVKFNKHYGINLFNNTVETPFNMNFPIAIADRMEIYYWKDLPHEFKNPKITSVWFDREIIENAWGMNPDHLCIVPMIGDKMTNYWYPIRNGDILIIDTSQNYIMGNGVYFGTSRNNTQFWIREMQLLMDLTYEFKGYAPSGETSKIYKPSELESVDFKLIGKVIKNVSFRL